MATQLEPLDPQTERLLGAELFNTTWTYFSDDDRSAYDDDEMLHMAHASAHHWRRVGTPANFARSEWLCSRVYAVLNRVEPCMHHAQRMLDICTDNGLGDFDLAFAYEALARAAALAGDLDQARSYTEQALAAAQDIQQDDDRELLISDLETIPGQPRFW